MNQFDLCMDISAANTMQMIRETAYHLWLEAGEPVGRNIDFWCEAERQIIGSNMGDWSA